MDLRGSGLTIIPEVFRNEALSRIAGHKIVVPEWHPPGWVARAKKGETALAAVNVRLGEIESDAAPDLDLRRKLEEAREVAGRLAETERAINAINAQGPERQAEWHALEERLARSPDEFAEAALDTITQGLLAARDTGRLGLLEDEVRAAKEKIDGFEERAKRAETLLKAARAGAGAGDRAEAIRELRSLASDLLLAADPKELGPLGRAVGPVARTLGWAGKLKNAAAMGRHLATLLSAGRRIGELEARTEREGAALRDELLPLILATSTFLMLACSDLQFLQI